jgi:hypothetical protein
MADMTKFEIVNNTLLSKICHAYIGQNVEPIFIPSQRKESKEVASVS